MQNITNGPSRRKIAKNDFLASTPAGAIKNLVSQDPLHLTRALGMSSSEVIALLQGHAPMYFLISTSMLLLEGKVTLLKAFFDVEEMNQWMEASLREFGTSQEDLDVSNALELLQEGYQIYCLGLPQLIDELPVYAEGGCGIESSTLKAVLRRDFSFWIRLEEDDLTNALERKWKEEVISKRK